MAQLSGIPIKDLTFAQLQEMKPSILGWVYPRHEISRFIPLLSSPQRAALNLYAWLAILLVPAAAALSLLYSWWWLLLTPGAFVGWKANRKSMEQFFLENLEKDASFYNAIRQTEMGDLVKIVLK